MKINPWAFGILFFVLAVAFMLNNFEIPFASLFKETKKADALIVNSKIVLGKLPQTKNLSVDILFKTQDTLYFTNLTLNNSYTDLSIGDSIAIEYQVDNPLKCKIERAYGNVKNKFPFHKEHQIFTYIKSNGFKELELTEKVFKFTDYGEYKKILTKYIGHYQIKNDTIKLKPLLEFKNNSYEAVSEKVKLSEFLITYDEKVWEINTKQKYD